MDIFGCIETSNVLNFPLGYQFSFHSALYNRGNCAQPRFLTTEASESYLGCIGPSTKPSELTPYAIAHDFIH